MSSFAALKAKKSKENDSAENKCAIYLAHLFLFHAHARLFLEK
jgi:hypothetical protein